MAVSEKISQLVKDQFPSFYKDEGPKFLNFVQAYYEYMEQNGKLTDEIRNLKDYNDVSLTTQEYLDYFIQTFLPSLPVDILADKRLMVKYIKEGNLARGSLQSYKFLFRALYNEDIDLIYPSDQILKVSDGDWRIDRYLVSNFNDRTYTFIGKSIKGIQSGATALVEDVVARNIRGRHIMQILLSNIEGTFAHLEAIALVTDTGLTGHTTVVDAGINRVEIIAPGGQYREGDIVEINSDILGRFGKVVVTGTQDLGGVLSFNIVRGGSGYVATDSAFGATQVQILGDNTQPADFEIFDDDIVDTFEISVCSTLLSSNTIYGELAPVVSQTTSSIEPISGTITSTNANSTVIGVGTSFTTELRSGDSLYYQPQYRTKVFVGSVDTISNNDVLTLDTTGTEVTARQVTSERTYSLTMSSFANTVIGASSYGFPETGENVTKQVYRDHEAAQMVINNTTEISVGDSLFGVTSGANATVTRVTDDTLGSTKVIFDGYRNFTASETVRVDFADSESGTDVGTVTSFSGNTISKHEVSVGVKVGESISDGDEVVGLVSNCYGVVKQTISTTVGGYTHDPDGNDDGPETRDLVKFHISANATAVLADQFDTGPILPKSIYNSSDNTRGDYHGFYEGEGLRLVNSTTVVGNVDLSTSNTVYETVATRLRDSILFETSQFGTIASLSDIDGGSGYFRKPKVNVTNPDISSLGIGEAYLTLQSDDQYWDTGETEFALDTTDRLRQSSTGASGDVKSVELSNGGEAYANGTYEMVVRVWQPFLQREPGNINWANDAVLTLESVTGTYIPSEGDTRVADYTGTAKVVFVDDRGVLGRNAEIDPNLGADGTITSLRILDSGFSYRNNEEALLEDSGRGLATSARVKITLKGAANSEGYYSSDRSHISTTRGYIQDSEYYQEFSYEILSGISLSRYRDIALQLVHPAGQRLFGKYRSVTSAGANTEVKFASTASENNGITTKIVKGSGTASLLKNAATGTISITDDSFDITGSSTLFDSELNAKKFIVIETDPGDGVDNTFWKVQLNQIIDDTSANLEFAWTFGDVTSANVYIDNAFVLAGTDTDFNTEFDDGDTIVLKTSTETHKFVLNTVNSATSANITSTLVGEDISDADVYYIQG